MEKLDENSIMQERSFVKRQKIESPFKEIQNIEDCMLETIHKDTIGEMTRQMDKLRMPSSPEMLSRVYERSSYGKLEFNSDSEDSDFEQNIDFLQMVGNQTIQEAFKETQNAKDTFESAIEEDKFEEEKSSVLPSENDDDLDERVIEEIGVEEVIVKPKKQKYTITKLMKKEKMKMEGITPGNYTEESSCRISSKKERQLQEAAKRFYASPNNCRDF